MCGRNIGFCGPHPSYFIISVTSNFSFTEFQKSFFTIYNENIRVFDIFYHVRTYCYYRRNVQSTMGGRHGLDASYIYQRLRIVHDNCVGAILADGLPKRGGRFENGHRTISGGHTCTVYGQVIEIVLFLGWMV